MKHRLEVLVPDQDHTSGEPVQRPATPDELWVMACMAAAREVPPWEKEVA